MLATNYFCFGVSYLWWKFLCLQPINKCFSYGSYTIYVSLLSMKEFQKLDIRLDQNIHCCRPITRFKKDYSAIRSLTVTNIKHKSWKSFFMISSPKQELNETEFSIFVLKNLLDCEEVRLERVRLTTYILDARHFQKILAKLKFHFSHNFWSWKVSNDVQVESFKNEVLRWWVSYISSLPCLYRILLLSPKMVLRDLEQTFLGSR